MNTMFDPRAIGNKTMKDAYPELKRIKEFDKLLPKQMVFVWFFACPSSPFFGEINDEKRCQLSIKESEIKFMSDKEADQYMMLQFPDVIKMAIDRMSKMDIGVRSKAREMVNTIIQNYEKYVNAFGKGEVEMDAYIASTQKIRKELPELIKLKEEGFAVVEQEDTRRNASKGQDYAKNYLLSKSEQ